MFRFRFFGIPVIIHPVFWLFLLLFTKIYAGFTAERVILGIVVFVSLLVHEFGHAWTARRFGRDSEIELQFFGGVARHYGRNISKKEHFLIVLNGPLFEAGLVAISYFLLKNNFVEDSHLKTFFFFLFRLNLIWIALNLIPIDPLDGGAIASYLLERKWGSRGKSIGEVVGIAIALAVALYLFSQGSLFFASLLSVFVFLKFQSVKIRRSFKKSPFQTYLSAVEAIKNKEIQEAKKSLKKLLKIQDQQIKHSAIEALAELSVQEGDKESGYQLLKKADPEFLRKGKVLLAKLAFERSEYALVTHLSREIYEIAPTYETALMNAEAFHQMNNTHLAEGWKNTASQFPIEEKTP